jgi:hypothetical protein
MKRHLPQTHEVEPAGLAAVIAGVEPTLIAPGSDSLETQSNVLKTRHDTAKNSIGNIR